MPVTISVCQRYTRWTDYHPKIETLLFPWDIGYKPNITYKNNAQLRMPRLHQLNCALFLFGVIIPGRVFLPVIFHETCGMGGTVQNVAATNMDICIKKSFAFF